MYFYTILILVFSIAVLPLWGFIRFIILLNKSNKKTSHVSFSKSTLHSNNRIHIMRWAIHYYNKRNYPNYFGFTVVYKHPINLMIGRYQWLFHEHNLKPVNRIVLYFVIIFSFLLCKQRNTLQRDTE